nr:uncharacterized mitochondrial protein AtMg00810-like [Tanacetum cinerariifolium]
MYRTLIEAARTMLADSFLPNTFWAEAVSTACYVFNRVFGTKPQNKTPYELIRPFGCHVTILNTINHLGKFNGKSDEGFLVGYSLSSKAFRPITAENIANKIACLKETNNSAELKSKEWRCKLNEDTDSKTNEEPIDQEDQAFLEELKRLKRQEQEANDAAETLRKTFAQSTEDLLLQAGASRASSSNYDIYEVSRDGIFTSASYDNEGAVADFINLERTMNVSPISTSRIHSIHPTTQIFGDPTSAVQTRSKVNKSMEPMLFGYIRGLIDKTLFIKKDKKDIMLVQVYVDHIIFGSTKKSWCDEFEALMKNRFQMSSMDELTFFLGLQVKQKEDGIFIIHDKYVAKILKKFDFLSVNSASTPIETKKPLVKDEEAANMEVHLYTSMIGSLMYLTASRPDIMYAICACSRLQVTLKTSHLQAVKRIFRYLKGQLKLGLWYPRESAFDLEAYSDSDYARANLDRKSTTGGCQFLGRRLISWQC